MKLPSKSQWRQFFKILTKKEEIIFFIFLFLFFSSFLFLSINFYFNNTEVIPAEGGNYIEGVVGSPRFINPIYAVTSDVDRALVEIIFSGLMKYDASDKIVPDLAKEYKILEEGKIYEFYLKENIFWSDGEPLTVNDVVFTIETIQSPEINSPLRVNWLGVEVEKISETALRFKLKNPSAIFLENCTVKIIPEHIWKDISPQNFPLSTWNLKPVGSGPYKLKDLSQDEQGEIKSLDLERNSKYFVKMPNLSRISFHFFDSEEQLIAAANSGKIKGLSIKPKNSSQLLKNNNFQQYLLSLPRYFAIFFNLNSSDGESKVLSGKEVRQALNYGTNKEEIIKEVLENKGKVVDSPILPEIYGFERPSKVYGFNPEQAKEILENAGFLESENGQRVKIVEEEPAFQFKSNLKLGSQGTEVKELQKCLANPPAGGPEVYPEGEITGYFGQLTKKAVIRFQDKYREEILEPVGIEEGTGLIRQSTRDKLNEICFEPPEETIHLKFSLATVDQPILIEVASLLQSQWEELGVEVEIKTFDISTLEREIIKPRSYEALLFGEVLGAIPDPFPFWSSLQKKDPGLNLAMYENKKCDKLLEEVRQSLDKEVRKEKLEEFQELLIEDAPALFLYNPDYLYLVSKEIKGINVEIITSPSKRFIGAENW
jgi:ABC-type transport system substrate-binding protein